MQQEELASASLALDAARPRDAECKRVAADQDSTVSGLEAELAGLRAAAHKQAVAVRRPLTLYDPVVPLICMLVSPHPARAQAIDASVQENKRQEAGAALQTAATAAEQAAQAAAQEVFELQQRMLDIQVHFPERLGFFTCPEIQKHSMKVAMQERKGTPVCMPKALGHACRLPLKLRKAS